MQKAKNKIYFVSLYFAWKKDCPSGFRADFYRRFREAGGVDTIRVVIWLYREDSLDVKTKLLYMRWLAVAIVGEDGIPGDLLETNDLKRLYDWLMNRVPRPQKTKKPRHPKKRKYWEVQHGT